MQGPEHKISKQIKPFLNEPPGSRILERACVVFNQHGSISWSLSGGKFECCAPALMRGSVRLQASSFCSLRPATAGVLFSAAMSSMAGFTCGEQTQICEELSAKNNPLES